MNKRILSILVENTAGVLSRVSGLFSRRGYNIDSLSVGITTDPNYSRMTVVCRGDELILEQITKQVEKLEDVLTVKVLKDGQSVNSELILVKVRVEPEQRPGISSIVDIFRANIIDVGKESMIIELTGTKSKLEAFIDLLEGYEILVTAIVGMLGIRPTIAAIEAGKTIALANKETLVTAGHIIMPLAAEKKVSILPVDSEHSAIFQSLNGERQNKISKILLTASGGPFRGKKPADLKKVRVEDALKHPNWVMGRKITIDSATLVNKGLEVMEAKWLFGVELDQIEVVVQPQSVIHSMVQYEDGSIIAQLGTPDMRLPIQYALYYPKRRPLGGKRLDFSALGSITFEKPDLKTFHGLALAYEAMRAGGNVPTIFNAANEAAVALFLKKKISYLQITEIIEDCMRNCAFIGEPKLEEILDTEAQVRERVESRW